MNTNCFFSYKLSKITLLEIFLNLYCNNTEGKRYNSLLFNSEHFKSINNIRKKCKLLCFFLNDLCFANLPF